jgi:hypothetical protein
LTDDSSPVAVELEPHLGGRVFVRWNDRDATL